MSSRLIIVLVLGVLTGVGTALVTYGIPGSGGDGQVQSANSGTVAIGGPFSLVDQTGARRTEKDYAGKHMLVFFGFTNCPDVCPSGLQILTVALDALGDKAERLTPIFITVDPERDTPEAMRAYVASFHSGIQGLTGTSEEVQAAVKAYRVYAKKVPDASDPTRYSVDHSAFFYLMDPQGRYVKHFPHSIDANKLAEDLKAVL